MMMNTVLARRSTATPASRTRGLLTTLVAMAGLFAATLVTSQPAQASSDPPAQFMRQVAREMLAAANTRSVDALAAVIRKYADVPTIGLFSLGQYAARLPHKDRPAYYNGMVRFMARYATEQQPKYPVARAQILGRSYPDSNGIAVDSRITLRDGSTYDVRWLVVKRASGYKVRDAQVMGFWLTPFQRSMFQSHIDEKGGSVRALLLALSRF
ncbi:MAG: ABC transporter substrate-binding protein [Hyphomicrobiaceae bacterium]